MSDNKQKPFLKLEIEDHGKQCSVQLNTEGIPSREFAYQIGCALKSYADNHSNATGSDAEKHVSMLVMEVARGAMMSPGVEVEELVAIADPVEEENSDDS